MGAAAGVSNTRGRVDAGVAKHRPPGPGRTGTLPSIFAVAPFHRFQQRLRVVADAVLEHGFDVFDVIDVTRGIAFHDDQVGILARGDRTDAVLQSQIERAVATGDADRLFGRETS